MNAELQLTPCDQQVVDLLLDGCSNEEIAFEIGIGPASVKQRLSAIYSRAGIRHGRKRVRLIGMFSAKEKRELPQLPPIQKQIAEMTISGLTNPVIAARCGASEQIVKNHLRMIFDKCGVWTRTELAARFAVGSGEGTRSV